MANELYLGNDSGLTATGLRNDAAGTYLNAATVTCQPYNVAVSGTETAVGSPVALAYVAGSNGSYAGTLESSVIDGGFAVGNRYRLAFTAVQSGVNAAWSIEGEVMRRGAS